RQETQNRNDQHRKPQKETLPGKAQSDVEKGTRRFQQETVGPEQQRKNEQEARKPPPPPKSPAEQKREAEKVGKTTTTAAEFVSKAEQDVERATATPGPYVPFAIEHNPLGMFVGGRISFNVEWAPVTHHVVTVSPHFVHTSADIATTGETVLRQTFTG